MDYKQQSEESFDGSKADKYIADEFGQTGKLHFQSPKQKELELVRYKQDCRKRAMDMAHQRAMQIGNGVEIDLKKAQEYYEWLTKDL